MMGTLGANCMSFNFNWGFFFFRPQLASPMDTQPTSQPWNAWLGWGLVIGCLLITGCRGCGSDFWFASDDQKEKTKTNAEQEKERKKPDFDTRTPVLLPGFFPPKFDPELERRKERLSVGDRQVLENEQNAAVRFNRYKLGHWAEAQISAVANNFNAEGQMSTWAVFPNFEPAPISGTDYFATTKRSISLPQGEWKYLETSVYLPRRSGKRKSAIVNYVVDRGQGSIPMITMAQGPPAMLSHQYHVVLLSERPDTYNFLNFTDCFQLRLRQDDVFTTRLDFYLLVPSLLNEPLPLPRQPLNWTTIAYLLWDDMDPTKLSRDHQTALIDWLHFGGQLILSGPDCLEKLENSFLGDFLPALSDGNINLTNESIAELNQQWSVPIPPGRDQVKPRVMTIAGDALRGVRFNPHVDSQFVPGTGELAIERQIGRGRIVVTSFPLNAPAVRTWPSFPSFLNGVLLRRPGRKFQSQAGDISFGWTNDGAAMSDPLIGSTLRFISRDLSSQGTSNLSPAVDIDGLSEDDQADYAPFNPWQSWDDSRIRVAEKQRNLQQWRFYGGFQDTADSGVAGWNDFSAISSAARATLVESAGIIPPSSAFVLKMLAGYLVVLVPLNWLVFRLIGRVEWAWIAAPFIAIFGAIAVINLASLDIGFVRSNTQVGFVEAWENYPRAHVSEYSALYTSLSTRYQALLDNNSGQSLPFASRQETYSTETKTRPNPVTIRKGVNTQLEGFQIQSNSTGLLHSEMMLDLDGAWKAERDPTGDLVGVYNGTYLNLKNAGAVWRTNDGNLQVSWLGDLASGGSGQFQWQDVTADDLYRQWSQLTLFSSSSRIAREIWNEHVGADVQNAKFEELAKIPDLANHWRQLAPILQRIAVTSEPLDQITLFQFVECYSLLPGEEKIQIGRMFDAIQLLELAPGEARLIGTTDEPLGRTKFAPESTRVNRQSLFLVHLSRPQLPPFSGDVNTFTDFTLRSDLDYKQFDN